ncbi:hypothetical protein EYF80_013538 [Liparis tanakae]|uniref:Uncharacterized protein n=1 Tax=Liparis tanakae TaxID=230148 RepID=A0A4Z2IEE0_9TELE|nr:hypothetical protein EYF80_013538 [Liparis tanakae]
MIGPIHHELVVEILEAGGGEEEALDQYNTSQAGSVHLSCDVSPWRRAGRRKPGGTEPKEDEDDDT